MADFQLLSCRIMLAGSKDSVVYRGAHNPLSYPEILIMQFLHGDDAVGEILEVGTLEMSNVDLYHHLQMTYPMEAIKECFPGARPNLPTRDEAFHKSRAVLMEAQAQREAARPREAPGPAPSPEKMTIPQEARPRPVPGRRHQSAHQADRVRRQEEPAPVENNKSEDPDAGPFAQ